MRDKKFQISLYQFSDGDAMARHVERMHRRGWHLEKVAAWGWTYRRGEPEDVHYAVTYFPAASVYDAVPTEDQMTYAEYCAAAGWEFVGSYGPMQYFRSREERPIPIETDEAAKLRAIHRSMLKTQVLSMGLLSFTMMVDLISVWDGLRFSFLYGGLSGIRDGLTVWLTGLVLLCLLYLLVMLGDYFLWYLRSRWSVSRGGACARNHWRLHLYGTPALVIGVVVGLMGYFLSASGEPGGVVWVVLLIFVGVSAVIAAEYGILTLARRQGWSREGVRSACILAAVVLALAYTGGTAVFFPVFLDTHAEDGHVTEPYTYLNAAGEERETTLYRDELPLTLEDLGVALPENIPYTCHADPDRSPLAWGGQYRQDGAVVPAGPMPPGLEYSVTVFRWQWLRDWCLERLVSWWDKKDTGYELADSTAWSAERVYTQPGGRWYLLVYPDRVVELRLEQVELTEEQMAIVAERLAA